MDISLIKLDFSIFLFQKYFFNKKDENFLKIYLLVISEVSFQWENKDKIYKRKII